MSCNLSHKIDRLRMISSYGHYRSSGLIFSLSITKSYNISLRKLSYY